MRPHQLDFAGDRQRGMRVIPGHHDDLDTGIVAFTDCSGYLRSRRVFEPDQSEKDHVLLEPAIHAGGQPSHREGQDAQTVFGHCVLRFDDRFPQLHVERLGAAVMEDLPAAGKHRLRRSLAVKKGALGRVVDHGVAHSVGVERDLIQATARRKLGYCALRHFD